MHAGYSLENNYSWFVAVSQIVSSHELIPPEEVLKHLSDQFIGCFRTPLEGPSLSLITAPQLHGKSQLLSDFLDLQIKLHHGEWGEDWERIDRLDQDEKATDKCFARIEARPVQSISDTPFNAPQFYWFASGAFFEPGSRIKAGILGRNPWMKILESAMSKEFQKSLPVQLRLRFLADSANMQVFSENAAEIAIEHVPGAMFSAIPGLENIGELYASDANVAKSLVSTVRSIFNNQSLAQSKEAFDELRNGFGSVVKELLKKISDEKHGKPTLIFIDDLDHIDPALQETLISLLKLSKLKRLMIVATAQVNSEGVKVFREKINAHSGLSDRVNQIQLGLPSANSLYGQMQKEFGSSLPRPLFDKLQGYIGGGSPVLMRHIIQALSGEYGGQKFLRKGIGDYVAGANFETILEFLNSLGKQRNESLNEQLNLESLIQRLVAQTLTDLTPVQKRCLAAAAIIGSRFPIGYIEKVLALFVPNQDTSALARTVLADLAQKIPFIEFEDQQELSFRSGLARAAVLFDQTFYRPDDCWKYFGAYLDYLLSQPSEHPLQREACRAETARVVIALTDQRLTLDDNILDQDDLTKARLDMSDQRATALMQSLPHVAWHSLGNALDLQVAPSEMVYKRENDILVQAVDHWFHRAERGERADEAMGQVRFLHEALQKTGRSEKFAPARAEAAIARLKIMLDHRANQVSDLRRRLVMAETEAGFVGEVIENTHGEDRRQLSLRHFELELLVAEAKAFQRASPKTVALLSKAEREEDARLEMFPPLLAKLGAFASLPSAFAQTELPAIAKDLAKRQDLETKRDTALRLVSWITHAAASLVPARSESQDLEVQLLYARALERYVRLARYFSTGSFDSKMVKDAHRDLFGRLEHICSKFSIETHHVEHAWAQRKLGLLLLDEINFQEDDTTDRGFREKKNAQRAFDCLFTAHRIERTVRTALEALRALDVLLSYPCETNFLKNIQKMLPEILEKNLGALRASLIIAIAIKIDRQLIDEMKNRGVEHGPGLCDHEKFLGKNLLLAALSGIPFLTKGERHTVFTEIFASLGQDDVQGQNLLRDALKALEINDSDSAKDLIAYVGRRHDLRNGTIQEKNLAAQTLLTEFGELIPDVSRLPPAARSVAFSMMLEAKVILVQTEIVQHADWDRLDRSLSTIKDLSDQNYYLARDLHDTPMIRQIATCILQVAQTFLDASANDLLATDFTASARLRNNADIWFTLAESFFAETTDLTKRRSIWNSQIRFHEEHGNLFEASTHRNLITRADRFQMVGGEAGGTWYAATEMLLRGGRMGRQKGARLLLEAVLLAEQFRDATMDPAVLTQLHSLREQLAVIVWQGLRKDQPRRTRHSIPLLPQDQPLEEFVRSSRGESGLVDDILQLWASEPPVELTPGMRVVVQMVRLHPIGALCRDGLGREFLLPHAFMPTRTYNKCGTLPQSISCQGLQQQLKKIDCDGNMLVVMLGRSQVERMQREWGIELDMPICTARGLEFIQGSLNAILPGLEYRRHSNRPSLCIGASNSAAAVFTSSHDIATFLNNRGVFHKQICNRLLKLRRLILSPVGPSNKKLLTENDEAIAISSELSDFATALWSDLSLEDVSQSPPRATFRLSIGASVDPAKERTSRSLLRKAFPDVEFQIIGGDDASNMILSSEDPDDDGFDLSFPDIDSGTRSIPTQKNAWQEPS